MSRTLQPEDQISHYKVVSSLGAGGMGEVYMAQDETLERSVALKVLPPQLVRNEERVRRFVTEAKSASSLNHPNIVTIYEIGQGPVRASQAGDGEDPAADPVHFISMELVTGETLTQKIHTERADLKTLVGWLAQAAEGIAKAHAAGIVHRDLKPGNIMVSKDGFAKVLDFGLAKLTEKQPAAGEEMTSAPTEGARTGEGVVMGTVGYMSPEQVQAKGVDHRSDIFSLGCILYEAATRKRPFVADTDVEVMHQILRDTPRPVEEVNPEVPAEIRRLIRRCLAKSPDRRFQSMKDLAIDLREAVEEWETLSATASSAGSGVSVGSGALGVPTRKSTAFWAVVSAAALLGIGGLAFGIWSLAGREDAPAAPAAAAQDLKLNALMSRNDLVEASLSSDGRYLAYATRTDQTTDLTVRQVRTGSDVSIISGNEFGIRGISFSPDADYLYYLNSDPDLPNYNALFQVASLGGTPRKIFFDVDTAATFSPDGKRLCWRRGLPDQAADSLVIGDLDSREERELVRVRQPESIEAEPAWSPDGQTIAMAVRTTAGGVRVRLVAVDPETGSMEDLGKKSWITINSIGWLPDGTGLLIGAFELGSASAPQIHRISWPGGEATRLTNDLNGYGNISIPSEGGAVAAVRRSTIRNLWAARDGDAQPLTFASGSAGSVNRVTPLPGGAVAFTAPRGNRVFLWRMEGDGSGKQQLNSGGVFVAEAWYYPGAGIVFTQFGGDEEIVGHIWRMDPDGSGVRQLTEGSGEVQERVSPEGNVVVFRKFERFRELWGLDPSGGAPWRITEDGNQPRISRDGTRMLFSRLEDMDGRFFPRRLVVPLEGGDPLASFLLPPGAFDTDWHPGGEAVTFVDRDRGWNLFRKELPDGEITPLTSFTEGQTSDYTWHPDGSRVLLHRRLNRQESLWILDPEEGAVEPVTEFKTGRIVLHVWDPAGDTIFFTYGDSTQDVVLISGIR